MTDKGKVVEAAVKAVKASMNSAMEKGAPPAPKSTTAVVDEPPANKDTRVSQRVKKFAEGTEKLGTKATPVVAEKGPVVIVSGMRLTPIQTGIKPNGSQGDVYSADGKEFWLPHQLMHNQHTRLQSTGEPWERSSNYEGPEMSLFVFVYDNATFHILMDEHSSFIREADAYLHRSKGGSLILINSSSYNDQFAGHALLANVETKNCIMNKSCIIANSRSVGRDGGWGGGGPFKLGDKRQKYENLRMKKTDVVDSELSSGKYIDCNITKSMVTSDSGENQVDNVSLTESRIHGNRIALGGLRGDQLDVWSDGEVTIRGISLLSHQSWRFPGIYITNRFAFTEIDYINRQDRGIVMVRSNPHEVEVRVQMWKDGLTLRLDAPRHTIEEALRKAVEDGKDKAPAPAPAIGPFGYTPQYLSPTFGPAKPGETIKSVALQYLVDQVHSRLGMIQLMDEVEETAKCLDPHKRFDYENLLD